jgi:hypothetical protein
MLTWLRCEAYSLLPIQWREESRDILLLEAVSRKQACGGGTLSVARIKCSTIPGWNIKGAYSSNPVL